MAGDDEGPIHTRDFRTIGMMWIVRHRHGGRKRFATLQAFLDARSAGEVADDDALSCDGVTWRLIGRIEDLPALFEEAWAQGADEDASMHRGLEQDELIDEPSVRLKFVPLPAPASARQSDPDAPPPQPATDERTPPQQQRLSTRSAMLLAAAAGVIMALILAAIVFAVASA